MTSHSQEVLYTSSEILFRLKALFSGPDDDDQRVALVAYVGDGARAYLASPAGLQIICNPSAGGTSARVLREFIQSGASVQFSGNLHSKVYWSKNRGCIIGSANASTSALGVGGLMETAVFLRPGIVDINKLIADASPKDATEEALAKLQYETRALPKKLRPRSDSTSTEETPIKDFSAWYNTPFRNSDPWKLGWWMQAPICTAKAAVTKAKDEYGVSMPKDFFAAVPGTVRNNDWLLCLEIDGEQLRRFQWLFVDFVVKVPPSDKKAYQKDFRCQAVQANANSKCPLPPFRITQPFRAAVRRAVSYYGIEHICNRRSLLPSETLLKKISESMAQ